MYKIKALEQIANNHANNFAPPNTVFSYVSDLGEEARLFYVFTDNFYGFSCKIEFLTLQKLILKIDGKSLLYQHRNWRIKDERKPHEGLAGTNVISISENNGPWFSMEIKDACRISKTEISSVH